MSDAHGNGPWRVLDSEFALDVPWMRIRRDRVVMQPATPAVDYFVWEGPDIATVVPRIPAGEFVVCRQYRHAIRRTLVQFPAGQVAAGESPADAAQRELLEETGYAARTVQLLQSLGTPDFMVADSVAAALLALNRGR